jgi:hypothetical protein
MHTGTADSEHQLMGLRHIATGGVGQIVACHLSESLARCSAGVTAACAMLHSYLEDCSLFMTGCHSLYASPLYLMCWSFITRRPLMMTADQQMPNPAAWRLGYTLGIGVLRYDFCVLVDLSCKQNVCTPAG